MVVSTLKFEIANRVAEQPEVGDVAAALAAVLAYMQLDASELVLEESVSATASGGWTTAARLEATGYRRLSSPRAVSGASLWRASSLLLLFLLWFFAAASAQAQDVEPSGSAYGASDDSADDPGLLALNRSQPNGGQIATPDPTAWSDHKSLFRGSGKTTLRVALALNCACADLVAIDGAQVRDGQTGALVAALPANSQWSLDLKPGSGGVQLALIGRRGSDRLAGDTRNGGSHTRNVAYLSGRAAPHSGQLRLPWLRSTVSGPDSGNVSALNSYVITPPGQGQSAGVIVFNGKVYRGSLWVQPVLKPATAQAQPVNRNDTFSVINLIDLEDYLLSVLPSEMPSSWALEALKAQAIAARSYAVANLGKHGADGYDLKATVEDQVYSGVQSENENSNRAVAETEGLILKYQGKPVSAFFHSTSGGSTELSEHVWGRALPYLQSVPDYDDSSPHFSWTRRLSVSELEKALPDIGKLLSLTIVARTQSNRAQFVLVMGTESCRLLSGQSLRHICRLPSTLFNIGCEDNSYVFAGRGFGHGLGMSQYGARAFADQGYNAAQILSYYYKDVVVDFIAAPPGI